MHILSIQENKASNVAENVFYLVSEIILHSMFYDE